jgi:molybdopterin-guanine dinucleotide biosynthesis protein A
MTLGEGTRARNDFGAAILAGGSAERLGLNKALVDIAGCKAIDRILDILRGLFSEISIIAQNESDLEALSRPGTRTVKDLLPGMGPLGGIYTALEISPRPYVFIMACDMPYPSRDLALHMLSLAPGKKAVVPRRGKYIEPLFAVYSKEIRQKIKTRLDRNDLKIHNLLAELDVLYLDEEEITRFDPEFHSFFNINTPEDLEKATLLASRGDD